MLSKLIQNRQLIKDLAINDFKAKYSNSFLGSVWAIILPLTNILVFWYVFQLGLKNGDVDDFPFIVWYIPAFLSWNYFSDAYMGAANGVREYSYLIKKVNFPIEVIPIVKVFSALFVHGFFILFIMTINAIYGIFPSLYYLQVLYYGFALTIYLAGLAWLFGSLSVVVPDVSNFVSIVLQLGFWVTPIIWNPKIMDENVQFILKINPLFYICQGYRGTFIYKQWFWENIPYTLYFWAVAIITWFLGAYVFDKTKDRFSDLL